MRTHAYTRDKKHTSFFSKVTFLLHPNTGLNVYKKKIIPNFATLFLISLSADRLSLSIFRHPSHSWVPINEHAPRVWLGGLKWGLLTPLNLKQNVAIYIML